MAQPDCRAQLIAFWADSSALTPEAGRPEMAVPPYHSFLFLVSLTLMGLILHLLLRRVRGPGPAPGSLRG